LLDYIEGVGQPLGFYATELRRRGWKDAVIHLPHDNVGLGPEHSAQDEDATEARSGAN
jgi:hypothetical protein